MTRQSVTLTDAELEGIAMQALNMAKHDLERDQFNFLLASYHAENTLKLHRMTKIEEMFIANLGEGWLNDEATKDKGFYLLRLCIDHLPPDAFVFASVVNAFGPGPKFEQLPEAQRNELLDAGAKRRHQAVKEGLLSMHDALWVVAQTPERACNCHQDLDRHRRPEGAPQVKCFPQSEFDGRIKMFGKGKHAFSE